MINTYIVDIGNKCKNTARSQIIGAGAKINEPKDNCPPYIIEIEADANSVHILKANGHSVNRIYPEI